MKQFRHLSALSFPIVLVAILGCASTQTQESTGQYFDDTWITTRVKTSLIGNPDVKATEVNVETFKGVVQLSGFVSSEAAMAHAVLIAQGIQGVTSVENDMRIK